MPSESPNFRPPNRLLRVALALMGSDVVDIVGILWRLGRRVLALQAHEGMYEVLDYEAGLELCDPKGEKAVYHKREQVRFLQDNIIAYQDQAWGDGNIFADYRCSPGLEVDRYREGHRVRILISLRETKNRNDVENFRIERTIRRGFMKQEEDFQVDIDHVTRKFSMSLVFPRQRFPKEVTLTEQNGRRTRVLGAENMMTLPDGRQQVMWSSEHPRLFESYILHWSW